jgi:hypothetical protein
MREYVLVVGADGDARFREDEDAFRILDVPTPIGKADITFRTRWSDEGFEARVPREIWIEVRGESEVAFKDAIDAYLNASGRFVPLIAFSANAYVGEPEPKLAFEATKDVSSREYFQSFVPEAQGLPRPGRNVNVSATIAVLNAAARHQMGGRLRRAIAQYARAVEHSSFGQETLALAHLYMGMEALTPVALTRQCEQDRVEPDELAAKWRINERRAHVRRTQLDAEVRRRILFQGDSDTLRDAKKASDGFEHGFLDFEVVLAHARDSWLKTSEYLRAAILDLSGVDAETQKTLVSPPFDSPLRSHITRYFWGRLVGETNDLAAPGQEYPIFRWVSALKEFRRSHDGKNFTMTPEETLQARFHELLRFETDGFEIWGPATAVPEIPTEPDATVTTPTEDNAGA